MDMSDFMGKRGKPMIAVYDFADAKQLSPDDRMRLSVEHAHDRMVRSGLWDLYDIPPVPERGASEEELQHLDARLGTRLPAEYRTFLRHWRYLIIDEGLQIWGFGHKGVTIGSQWRSTEYRSGYEYLIVGDYWNYADGDQLMFDMNDRGHSVYVYLHEDGPAYELFATSFSLALWRMVHEKV